MHSARMLGSGDQRWVIGKADQYRHQLETRDDVEDLLSVGATAVAIGTAIGLQAETALALAILVHATTLLVTTLLGLVAFARISARRPTMAHPDDPGVKAASRPPQAHGGRR